MPNIVKQGARQQVRTLSERITALEQGLAQVLYKINQRFSGIDGGLIETNEQIEALIELTSSIEEVQKVVERRRIERARAQAEREKASLEEGVKEGYLLKAEKAGAKSLIVGRYLDKEGKVEEPGRVQLAMPAVAEQFRDKLMGQAVGTTLDLPSGGKYELTEIYDVDDAKYKALQEAKQKAAQEAAAQAAKAQGDADEAQDTAPEQEQPAEASDEE